MEYEGEQDISKLCLSSCSLVEEANLYSNGRLCSQEEKVQNCGKVGEGHLLGDPEEECEHRGKGKQCPRRSERDRDGKTGGNLAC